jgi:hypothetical protein
MFYCNDSSSWPYFLTSYDLFQSTLNKGDRVGLLMQNRRCHFTLCFHPQLKLWLYPQYSSLPSLFTTHPLPPLPFIVRLLSSPISPMFHGRSPLFFRALPASSSKSYNLVSFLSVCRLWVYVNSKPVYRWRSLSKNIPPLVSALTCSLLPPFRSFASRASLSLTRSQVRYAVEMGSVGARVRVVGSSGLLAAKAAARTRR